MEREQYAELQEFSDASRREFEQLLAQATFLAEPPRAELGGHEQRAAAYAAAGRTMVARGDVLVALWDASPAEGQKRGGTADTLLNAAAQGAPCVWIAADGDGAPLSNLEPGTAAGFFEEIRRRSGLEPEYPPRPGVFDRPLLEPLRGQLLALERYNREPTPALIARGFEPEYGRRAAAQLSAGAASPIAEAGARAGLLAEHYQLWFKRLSRLVVGAAAMAAAMLALAVGLRSHAPWWPSLEFGSLAAVLIGFVLVRQLELHGRWLSYRVLAERFRTARYLVGTGVDFRELARPQGVSVETQSEAWLMRAFEEVWDTVPRSRGLSEGDVARVKELLASDWIGGQIDYHARTRRRHDRHRRGLSRMLYLAFALTLAAAAVDALLAGLDTSHDLLSVAQALCIFLPVAGASLGAVLTINQHDALAVRSERMQADLALVQQDLAAAATAEELRAAIVSATQVVAPETGTWFGTLWFLDIEHP